MANVALFPKWLKLANVKEAAIPKLRKMTTVLNWKKVIIAHLDKLMTVPEEEKVIIAHLDKLMTVPEEEKVMAGTASQKTAGTTEVKMANASRWQEYRRRQFFTTQWTEDGRGSFCCASSVPCPSFCL